MQHTFFVHDNYDWGNFTLTSLLTQRVKKKRNRSTIALNFLLWDILRSFYLLHDKGKKKTKIGKLSIIGEKFFIFP